MSGCSEGSIYWTLRVWSNFLVIRSRGCEFGYGLLSEVAVKASGVRQSSWLWTLKWQMMMAENAGKAETVSRGPKCLTKKEGNDWTIK